MFDSIKKRIFNNPITSFIAALALLMGIPAIQRAQETESIALLVEGAIAVAISIWGFFSKDRVSEGKK